MGLKEIIEGLGSGFWFGYGRFLGVHWGFASSQDVIEVAADPFYDEKKFRQLVVEPFSHIYRGRWRADFPQLPSGKKGRILTDKEKEGIIETLFQRATEYEGSTKTRMFRRLIANRDFAGKQRVEDFCVEAVNNKQIEPDLLMEVGWRRDLGSLLLARVDPNMSTAYLSRMLDKLDNPDTRRFWRILFYGLGINDNRRKDRPIFTSETIVPWMPLIVYAIEYGAAYDPFFLYDPSCIEEFFAGFPYEAALPHLLKALQSEVCVKGKSVARELIATNQVRFEGETCSYCGTSDGGRNVYYDTYEVTFDSRYPVADGARSSLRRLEELQPHLKPQIDEGIGRYVAKPKKTFTERSEETTRFGEYTGGCRGYHDLR